MKEVRKNEGTTNPPDANLLGASFSEGEERQKAKKNWVGFCFVFAFVVCVCAHARTHRRTAFQERMAIKNTAAPSNNMDE